MVKMDVKTGRVLIELPAPIPLEVFRGREEGEKTAEYDARKAEFNVKAEWRRRITTIKEALGELNAANDAEHMSDADKARRVADAQAALDRANQLDSLKPQPL